MEMTFNKAEIAELFPELIALVVLMGNDTDLKMSDSISLEEGFITKMKSLNKMVKRLSPSEINLLAIGEDSDRRKIAKKQKIGELVDFLDDLLDGKLHRMFFTRDVDYVDRHDMFRKVGIAEKWLTTALEGSDVKLRMRKTLSLLKTMKYKD